jgi:hypothetical protein
MTLQQRRLRSYTVLFHHISWYLKYDHIPSSPHKVLLSEDENDFLLKVPSPLFFDHIQFSRRVRSIELKHLPQLEHRYR